MKVVEFLVTTKDLHLEVLGDSSKKQFKAKFNDLALIVSKGEVGDLYNKDQFLGLILRKYYVIDYECN